MSRYSVHDDGVITLTVATVCLKTGVGLRPYQSTTAANDDGSGTSYIHVVFVLGILYNVFTAHRVTQKLYGRVSRNTN